jgi:hypothetical protein
VPDYRKGRGHLDFCTNLQQQGYSLAVAEVIDSLDQVVKDRLFRLA